MKQYPCIANGINGRWPAGSVKQFAKKYGVRRAAAVFGISRTAIRKNLSMPDDQVINIPPTERQSLAWDLSDFPGVKKPFYGLFSISEKIEQKAKARNQYDASVGHPTRKHFRISSRLGLVQLPNPQRREQRLSLSGMNPLVIAFFGSTLLQRVSNSAAMNQSASEQNIFLNLRNVIG